MKYCFGITKFLLFPLMGAGRYMCKMSDSPKRITVLFLRKKLDPKNIDGFSGHRVGPVSYTFWLGH